MPDDTGKKQFDLNALNSTYNIAVESETLEERTARLVAAERDGTHNRWRQTIFFVVAMLGVVAVGAVCVRIQMSSTTTAEDKKWATALLSSMVAGAIGYLTGRKSG